MDTEKCQLTFSVETYNKLCEKEMQFMPQQNVCNCLQKQANKYGDQWQTVLGINGTVQKF